ncbi:MAG: hypothetical protein NVS3B17_02380 [Vulcanimicrobiaceae bacterium]
MADERAAFDSERVEQIDDVASENVRGRDARRCRIAEPRLAETAQPRRDRARVRERRPRAQRVPRARVVGKTVHEDDDVARAGIAFLVRDVEMRRRDDGHYRAPSATRASKVTPPPTLRSTRSPTRAFRV